MLTLKLRENRKMEKWEKEKITYELVEIKHKFMYLNKIVEITKKHNLNKEDILILFENFFKEYKTQLNNLFLLLDTKEYDFFKWSVIPAIKKDSNITDVELEEMEKMVSYYDIKPIYYEDGQNGGYEQVYSLFDIDRFKALASKLEELLYQLCYELDCLINELLEDKGVNNNAK